MDEQVKRYLKEFRSGLRHIPATERDDMVKEMESHIAEALSSGRPVADVLARLGPADRLARAMAAQALLDAPDDGLRMRRWFAILGLLAFTGLPSLVIVPGLALLIFAFGFAGVVGTVVSFLSLTILHNMVTTSLPHPNVPGGAEIVTLPFSMLLGLVAVGLTWLLNRYIKFLLTAARNVMH